MSAPRPNGDAGVRLSPAEAAEVDAVCREAFRSASAIQWNPYDPIGPIQVRAPATKDELDRLREALLEPPHGFLATIYQDIYRHRTPGRPDIRMDNVRELIDTYRRTLK